MKKMSKWLTVLLVIAILTNLIVGCTSNNEDKEVEKNQVQANIDENKSEEKVVLEEITLPIVEEPVTLKYWVALPGQAAKAITNFSENAAYQEYEKLTNVKIQFIHPPVGQAKEQFNLMIAANDLPDIIETTNSGFYKGGVDQAIEDGTIIRLNELVEQYAPNYRRLRASNEEMEKLTITDEGNIWSFGKLLATDEPTWLGPIIRKDWLDDLGMEVPETMNEWHDVLVAFKEEKGATAPLQLRYKAWDMVLDSGAFIGAFGINKTFYNDNGTVKYGAIQPEYKEFLVMMNQWYEEGLIDLDFATSDQKALDAMATSGKSGAWLGGYGANLDGYEQLVQKSEPTFKLVPAPYPSMIKGENVEFRQKNWRNRGYEAAITTVCEYPEIAVQWLDFHYTEQGSNLLDFGIEGQSYNEVDGKIVATEAVLNHPDGLTFNNAQWFYKVNNGPYLKEVVRELKEPTENVKLAREIWTSAGDAGVMPPLTHMADESEELGSIMSEVQTYVEEMYLKFIMGIEPIENFDDYLERVKSMDIEKAIEIKQAALERFNQR